ncbi:hypothetical protein FRAHR75_940025 [Frankia sp. Hr75.2]|nr:hypothetical protein FRAHR75_940025 [Frankia sp. Hr75.2]
MADPKPGVARIVKLGAETLLIAPIENGQDVPEDDYTINKIEAVPAEEITGAAPCGAKAGCGGKGTCSGACVIRFAVQ